MIFGNCEIIDIKKNSIYHLWRRNDGYPAENCNKKKLNVYEWENWKRIRWIKKITIFPFFFSIQFFNLEQWKQMLFVGEGENEWTAVSIYRF